MAEDTKQLPPGPFFFLSYTRSHPEDDGAGQSDEEDQHVIEFYKDLCRHIKQLAVVEPGVSPGYFDRAMKTSVQWPDQVRTALATCRTFVALYKPGYFRSQWCSWEWAAFEARQKLTRPQGSIAHDAIIPVLWVEERRLPNPLPAAARYIQYSDLRALPAYRQEGVYGLRESGLDAEYRRTTLAIARRIVDVAETMQIPTCSPSVFQEGLSAFDMEAV